MLTVYLDALLDLHAKLSTVVRYYDRMLEERLSSTYSHHNVEPYASAPPGRRSYNNYPALSQNPPDVRHGAENFYLPNNMPDQFSPNMQSQLPQRTVSSYSTATPAPGVGSPSPYPTLNLNVGDAPNQTWNQNNAQTYQSPLVTDSTARFSAPPGAAGVYSGHAAGPQEPTQIGSASQRENEPSYRPSPIMRHDSQYQQSATTPGPYASPQQQFVPAGEPQQLGYHSQEAASAYQSSHEPPTSQHLLPLQQSPPHNYSQHPSYTASTVPLASPANGPYPGYPGAQTSATYPSHSQLQESAPPKPIVEESLIDL